MQPAATLHRRHQDGGRKPVLISAKIEPRECYHFEMPPSEKIPFWVKEEEKFS
jgi:hypothetical protein